MFKYLLTLALVMVFGATSYMSVSGLVSVFSDNLLLIIVLGSGLELGKILAVVFLHRHWGVLAWPARVMYGCVIGVLLMITTCEVFGYLSLNHKSATAGAVRLIDLDRALEDEFLLLEGQVRVIDETLAQLPAGYVSRRIRERKAAGYDEKQGRMRDIVRARADLAEAMADETKTAGPVMAVAGLIGVEASRVALWFILVLVGVLEPLSVGLAVAVSGVWATTEAGWVNHPVAVLHGGHEEHEERQEEEKKEDEPEVVEADVVPDEVAEGDANYLRLSAISREHGLTAREIMKITRKKKVETVVGWLDGSGPVPDKAIRALEKFVRAGPKLRAVS